MVEHVGNLDIGASAVKRAFQEPMPAAMAE